MSERQSTKDRQLFPPRSGEHIERFLDILSKPPERPLSEQERAQVSLFEAELMDGRYTTSSGDLLAAEEERSLEIVEKESSYLASRHEITVDYFLSPEGKQIAAENGLIVPESSSREDVLILVRRFASDLSSEPLSEHRKSVKKLASASRAWAVGQLIDEMAKSQPETPDFLRIMVFDDTAKLRNAVQSFEVYRSFCLKVRADLQRQQHTDNVVAAKHTVADIYTKVVNGKLAERYPDMLWAWDQAVACNDEDMKRELRMAWPAGEQLARVSPPVRQHYIRALDQLRNGTAYENGAPTAINQELRELFAPSDDQHERQLSGGRFTPEECQRLAEIKLDAIGMQAFCKDILSELGLLSSESEATYYADRPHRAQDNKWQVVIIEGASAMGAEDPEGVLEIPASFNRNITKAPAPVGAAPGAAHEIMHIYQLENLRAVHALRLAGQLRGRSSLVLREAGGVYVEHMVQAELFGARRPDSPHYMNALSVLESGGGEKAAIRVFYEGYRKANPDEPLDECVKVAESRVMRLCRRYGGFNSQPLNYAQTAAFVGAADRMTDAQRRAVFAEGAFDLPDMVSLHQFGLLSDGGQQFPIEKFCDIVERKLRKMLE